MDADEILERRRLRRRASFWRIAAFVILVAAILIAAGFNAPSLKRAQPQVARIDVEGFIGARPDAVEQIRKAAASSSVKAILIRINSPGGAASGGEALYKAIRDADAKKPTVAVINGLGASAAYMTAIATDRIFAGDTTITGSIGVILEYGHIEGLLDKLGVKYEEIKSAPLKGQPSLFLPTDPAATAMLQSMINDSFNWFVGLVADRRGMSEPDARKLSDGSVFTGRQAVTNHLIDQVGDEDDARAWLEKEKGVSASLPLVEWKKKQGGLPFLGNHAVAGLLRLLGVSDDLAPFAQAFLPRQLSVDGLLAVWQPAQSSR
ncbi:signal peptide peptidase A. Serine peptidase. MEROPS family S49 [Faunimonas pinastri]|uniref:Signal peptide peptidase A. Serine peptidase. MEROPS family S49 n=1 Tax=Faunimonas pinastri TaxID=1855383 RepID=A0A1H9GL83_9HYPH|nr:signal peptide peptidase SppA [Faunimonas pinastri]SEQ50763.1 signal peptide peptidase A. Serine peptidase. MEROPS family S49 [Faunimonas pinastri]